MHINHNSDSDDQDADDGASIASDDSETSSDITQLDQTEFPTYFREHDGRLFHSHGNAPYPLPVDAPEQQRIDAQHALLFQLLGRHARGPVHRVVSEQGRVLDLCTGTGRWVLDMARDFPNVKFDGIDIVPIATRTPPSNVWFEMANVNDPWRYNNGVFDFVHARSVSMAVVDYPGMLDQVARVLRPGGLFVACEWGRSVHIPGSPNPRAAAPYAYAFFDAVNNALAHRGIVPAACHLEEWLDENEHFVRIRPRTYEMPIGDWPASAALQQLGVGFRVQLRTYAESMAALLTESLGMRTADVERLIQGFKDELCTVHGMVCRYYTVHARRRVLT